MFAAADDTVPAKESEDERCEMKEEEEESKLPGKETAASADTVGHVARAETEENLGMPVSVHVSCHLSLRTPFKNFCWLNFY